ncbi:MAG: aromatic acid decarboxylase [Candidatus Altiarchaeales archaeon IMC4]|nr:MAG: aromatic acid decarboxylase [Candidatus Altiarchaeales archaeon IMC4]
MRIIVAVTGASGVVIAKRVLESLSGHEVHLIVSENAKKVMKYERVEIDENLCKKSYSENDMAALIASSSFAVDAMVIVPCSMKTLSAVANGFCDNLIVRAAENVLKMGKRLVVVPRDTPLTLAAIENMRRVKLSGGIILPPVAAYYNEPKSADDMTDFFVGKILDVLGIKHGLYKKWKGD